MTRMSCVFLLLFAGIANAQQPVIVRNYPTPAPMPRMHSYTSLNTSSAQGVAEMMASRGVIQHFGNPAGGYEGVGSGATPEQALNNCCYSRSGMRVFDQGVAQGRNGRWYACKRYR